MAKLDNGRGETRVLVFAASAVRRAGLESLLGQISGVKLVGGAYNFSNLLAHVRDLQADVVITDQERTDPQLLSLASSLHELGSRVGIVVLIDNPEPVWTRQALRVGVNAILSREVTKDELLWSIQVAHAGMALLDPDAARSVTEDPQRVPEPRMDGAGELTPREIEVLAMMADGLGNKQIAVRLEISEHTVKYHISSILDKLGASGRTEAVTLGIRRGLVLI
jgi:two-component system, NarL family, response regulator YdfI